MNSIIQFPTGKERVHFKRKVAQTKRNNIFKAMLQFVTKAIAGIFFSIRLTIATTLHHFFCVTLSIFHRLNVFLFFFLGLGCVITYFHLGKNFTSPTNYAIPFFIGVWVLSCSSQHIVFLIEEHFPFHRIMKVAKNLLALEDKQELKYY